MKTPDISVIILSYNCSSFIERAFISVLNNSKDLNLEIIFVDDCSTDNTKEILSKIADNHPHVRLIYNKTNQKQGVSRNRGLLNAMGKYIFFLDGDDWLEEGAFIKLYSLAQKENADVAAGGVQKSFPGGRKEFYHGCNFISGKSGLLEKFSKFQFGAIVWNKLYLRDFLLKEKIIFIGYYHHEDIPFTLDIASCAQKVVSTSDIVINYFFNDDSIVNRNPSFLHLLSYINLMRIIPAKIDGLLKKKIIRKPVAEKIIDNYVINEVFPKLEKYQQCVGNEKFKQDLEEAVDHLPDPTSYFICKTILKTFKL